jgi:TRAP-type transport system small permease protein
MTTKKPNSNTPEPANAPKLEVGLEKIAGWFNWIAIVSLFGMFAIMVSDILSSKLFNRPVIATVDIASLLAVVVASFSVSRTILAGRHIEVEFVVTTLPRGARKVLNALSSFLSLAFFLLIVWRTLIYALHLQRTGESSLTQHIPMAPFAYGMAIACIPAVMIYVYKTYSDTKKVR